MLMVLAFLSQLAVAATNPQLNLAPKDKLLSEDRNLVEQVALAEAKHEQLQLTPDQYTRFVPTWKTPVANNLEKSLVDLGTEADALAAKLNEPLTPELALQYLVITKTYEANAVKFEFDPMTPERSKAVAKIKALTPLLEKSASLKR